MNHPQGIYNHLRNNFDPISDRTDSLKFSKDRIKTEGFNEYYPISTNRNSVIRPDRSDNGADSMLSLYNKIPDSKNIKFNSSQVSQEFQKKRFNDAPSIRSHKKTKSSKIEMNDKQKLELPGSSSRNPYEDRKKPKDSNKSSVNGKSKKSKPKSSPNEESNDYEEDDDEDDDDDDEDGSEESEEGDDDEEESDEEDEDEV